ncbi:putative bifunctional diguanylate cyclase/phosphodiesterase [Thiocystis violascens]|uniref:cyclic-guanylate-specific phosphodiesterase n=1 Tax=Thiocystis violascens (strain ATCC 17096 / DSM 198 / 6111) TaxID=765911 RepID=I3YAP6_THIV6|nr:GGDEF domain-containing response regulator [Thiocystis violascens]AFL74064.1 PAS domain S-box/diguanylate cyclase (GGDEF) domain-containing protein [Thiocystis violascens DSM 198]
MPLRVLIVEDLPLDAELMALRLQEEGFDPQWTRAQNQENYLLGLEQGPDLILCDWHLPRFSGQRALALLRERGLNIPFIIVSGGIGEEAAVEALRLGANDYVMKDRPARLGEAVRRVLEEKRLRDVHDRDQEQLRLAERVFQNTAEGIKVTDAAGNLVSVNAAFETITGYRAEEALGRNPRFLKSARHDAAFYRNLWATLLETGHWRGEIWNRRKSGEVYPEWLTISAVPDDQGRVTHYVGVFSDITHLKEAQKQIDFLAYHDALTHLPNRTLFRDRLVHALAHARRETRTLAVLFIDLDRFKTVNDTLGHPVGDELLLQVSRRMSEAIRADDTLARLGGDEFVLLLEDADSAQRAATVARKLLECLASSMRVSGHELTVTASLGISLYPTDGEDADTLIRHADRAMYEAKQRGRNNFQFFTQALTDGAFERLVMENVLRGAVGRGELVLHYQPQIALASGRLMGFEALVRWNHPELGLVPPGRFIPLAEEIGIIGDIGAWVLRAACRQLADWDAQGFAVPRMGVNLSVKQIDDAGLTELVASALREAGLGEHRLELEVTESMLMGVPETNRAALNAIKSLGVELAVDDFGTGYSNLAYLKLLPLDRLKIDQSFVRDIGRDGNDEAIVRAIIALARSLGLETVAEGVEEAHQAEFLLREGCNLAQGYLYSRPLPAEALSFPMCFRRD